MTLAKIILILGVFVCCGYGVMAEKIAEDDAHVDLSAIGSPVLIAGDSRHACCDPAVVYYEGVFVLTSKDLANWSKPRLLKVKGPDVPVEDMGRMIDAFLLEDKDEPGKTLCRFFRLCC